jgi:GT2 family glycosyltransferase/ADP-heptose:LPS heptosyltransferase
MNFSFVIPNYKGHKLLETCLATLRVFHKDDEVIVVDDNSPGEFKEYIREVSKKYNAKLIENKNNVGFATTVNNGIQAASGDVFILVNNDIIFTQNITQKLEEDFNNIPKLGIVGGLLFYPNGNIQHGGIIRQSYQGRQLFHHRGWGPNGTRKPFKFAPEVWFSDFPIACTGALLAINKEMVEEIGYLCQQFFLAFEDVAYNLKAWENDWKVFYDRDIKAIHAEGATRGNSVEDKKKKNPEGLKKEIKGQAIFEKKCLKIDFNKIDEKREELNNSIKIKKLSAINKKAGSITIKRVGALGDVLMITPIVRFIKKQFPYIDIHIMTKYFELFKNNPYVNSASLQYKDCDMFIDLDGVYESKPGLHILDSYAIAVLGFGLDLNDENFHLDMISDQETEKSEKETIDLNFCSEKYICINMSKSWDSRTLSIETWDKIISSFLDKNYFVVNLGTDKDDNSTHESNRNYFDLRGKLSIHQTLEWIKHSSLYIGMDSGLLHVAQCTDTPVVGIFTCVEPGTRITRKEKTIAIVPEEGKCAFCWHTFKGVTNIECNLKNTDNYLECCTITAENIINNTKNLLGESL